MTAGIFFLVALVVAAGVFVEGLIVRAVWNSFVFHHVAGVQKASLGASILVAVAITTLVGASSQTGRRSNG